jgi:hypothetical protein
MYMTEKFTHILKSGLIFLTSGIYFALAYIGYNEQDIELKRLSTYTGKIDNLGVDYLVGAKGRRSLVFFIDLQGLDQRLGIYRMDKDYKDLYQLFTLGETITVYFQNHRNSENININLIQIEKGGFVVLSKNEYEKKEGALIWIGLSFGILTIIISWLYYKRVFTSHRK